MRRLLLVVGLLASVAVAQGQGQGEGEPPQRAHRLAPPQQRPEGAPARRVEGEGGERQELRAELRQLRVELMRVRIALQELRRERGGQGFGPGRRGGPNGASSGAGGGTSDDGGRRGFGAQRRLAPPTEAGDAGAPPRRVRAPAGSDGGKTDGDG
jgi:hypothetical protein